MKHIIKGIVLIGMSLGISFAAVGQTVEVADSLTSVNDSLVHVAYRTVNKNDLSNAISVFNPAEILDKNYSTYPLEGIAALVGGENLWKVGTPMILVDGIQRATGEVTTSEIEQITFLKGANAVVLYGSRAAHGAILITTKRGKIGDRKSNVYFNTGINVPIAYPKYLGSADYMKYYNQALKNDGLKAQYDSITILRYANDSNKYRYPNVDYYSSDYLRKMYNSYNASADFSGGNDRAQFYAVAGIESQNSLLNFGEGKNDNITRLNLRGNIDLKLNDFIKTFVNMSNVFYDARQANGSYWKKVDSIQPHRFSPLIPIDLIPDSLKDAQTLVKSSRHIIDGKYLLGGAQEYLTNPISDVYAAGYNTYTSRQFQYSSGLDIDLGNAIKGLTFHGQMGIDYSNSYTQAVNNTYAIYVPKWKKTTPTDSISGLTKYNKDSNTGTQNLSGNWNSQVIDFNMHFDYNNTFNDLHNVSAMVLVAGYRARQTGDYQYRTNSNMGLQFNYNYNQKYYFDFSGAIVNSTKLSKEKSIAFSPTASLGWVLSNEEFLKGNSTVNRLKVSASAGIINTDLDINNYFLYDEKYTSSAWYSWADGTYTSQTTTISRGANENLTFSQRKEFSFGIEGTLFNNLLDFQTNVFTIKKDGIPVQSYTQYPNYFRTYYPETSFVPYTNYEANSYNGFDFQLNFNKRLGDVMLTVGAAGTYVVSEALVRDELYADVYRNRAGKPTDAIFGLESEGFFADLDDIKTHPVQKFGAVKPGDIKYKDQNNDGIIDDRDEVMIGRWRSPLTYGLHFTAQWKRLTLFVLGTGQTGGTAIKDGKYYWIYGNRKYSDVVLNSWTEETKNTANYPRLTTLSGDNNFRNSDFWTYSTDQFNLAKVQLTYAVPVKISFVKGLNIYANGMNLLKIAKNKEVMELNVGSTPYCRSYNLGIKAIF